MQLFKYPNAFYSIFYKRESDATNENISETHIKIMKWAQTCCIFSFNQILHLNWSTRFNCEEMGFTLENM